jgi:hypothetical protein
MANRTLQEIFVGVVSTSTEVTGTGIVLDRERNIEKPHELPWFFIAMNVAAGKPEEPKGILWTLVQPADDDDTPGGNLGVNEVRRTWHFKGEFIYPYDDAADSTVTYRNLCEQLANAFMVNRSLKLTLDGRKDRRVRNQLLKPAAPMVVRRWKAGSESLLTHYTVFDLYVEVIINAAAA